MNSNIKILIIILVFTSNIFARELIITIPEKYGLNYLPLPPFPEEVMNSLDEVSNTEVLLNTQVVRDIKLNSINYTYYPEFLDFGIGNRSFLSHSGGIETDLKGVKLLYLAEYAGNNFVINGGLSFDTKQTLLNIKGEYREFRLPIDLSITGSMDDLEYSMTAGQTDYYRSWSINPGLKNGNLFINIDYKDRRFIKPYFSFDYISSVENSGVAALGWKSFRTGLSFINYSIYPYIEYTKIFNQLDLNLKSEVNNEKVDYRVTGTIINKNFIALGLGNTIANNYKEYNPYLYIRENILPGTREYQISMEDINFKCSFIKDQFKAIISLKYLYNSNQFSMDMLLTYKVGKI